MMEAYCLEARKEYKKKIGAQSGEKITGPKRIPRVDKNVKVSKKPVNNDWINK